MHVLCSFMDFFSHGFFANLIYCSQKTSIPETTKMTIFQRIMFQILLGICLSAPSFATTFAVNTSSDTVDINPGNGVCADAGNNCSLRAAISEANALAGADIITLGAATYTQTLIAPGDDANAGGDWD